MPGCALWCIADREAAAAAVAAARPRRRPAPLWSLGLAVVLCLLRCRECALCVVLCILFRGFGLGIKLGACRPIVRTAGVRINLERSLVQIVQSSGKFRAVFLSSSFHLLPSGDFLWRMWYWFCFSLTLYCLHKSLLVLSVWGCLMCCAKDASCKKCSHLAKLFRCISRESVPSATFHTCRPDLIRRDRVPWA